MLSKFLLIGASVLAFASSALAALPAVADNNDFLILTQPHGRKVLIAPFSIVAIWSPPHEVRGPGLVHRIAADVQREFVAAPVAKGVEKQHDRSTRPVRKVRRLP